MKVAAPNETEKIEKLLFSHFKTLQPESWLSGEMIDFVYRQTHFLSNVRYIDFICSN
jgi:hypothetical protein